MRIRTEFKRPIRVTVIAFGVALILVIAGSTWIYLSESSSSRANRRAEMMGSGVGLATCLVVAPFWFIAAGKVGQERRAQRLAAREERKSKNSGPRP